MPVQLPLASVVLAAIVDGVCFKALQLRVYATEVSPVGQPIAEAAAAIVSSL